ncbi:hypothetical protein CEXT_91861 [Caerostris extrusa]|uniref:Uncharacterized protein n=1 Tax=Caerostris extrusa TaxID=172846 RepID=A0AAV4M4N0_CAEEX|nr:hypothetical protein CEXT_91861 [Caerostris extrusa]
MFFNEMRGDSHSRRFRGEEVPVVSRRESVTDTGSSAFETRALMPLGARFGDGGPDSKFLAPLRGAPIRLATFKLVF